MASPQKENGYTAIANEILEHLVKVHLLGAEWDVLAFIIRKTYGYQKKLDVISLTQFESGTGLSRPTVVKTLKNLMARNMIVKVYLPDERIGYTFIKDHEKWVVKEHLLVKDKWVASKGVFTKTSKGVLTHKRKKEITKEIMRQQVSQEEFSLKEYLKSMEDNKNRHINVIGHYFEEKGLKFENREEIESAIKRHLRPAVEVSKFTDDKIMKATTQAKKEYPELWTVETILKVLTR
jgi:phage replication O-like protein O